MLYADIVFQFLHLNHVLILTNRTPVEKIEIFFLKLEEFVDHGRNIIKSKMCRRMCQKVGKKANTSFNIPEKVHYGRIRNVEVNEKIEARAK